MTKFSVAVVILVQLLIVGDIRAHEKCQCDCTASKDSEEYKAFQEDFDSLRDHCKANFSDVRTIPLACKLQTSMEKFNKYDSPEDFKKYENLKNKLPLNVQKLIWGKKSHLINKSYPTEYLYAVDESEEDTQNRRIFSWIPGGWHSQGVWVFIPQNSGKSFLIQSNQYNQYLCPGSEGSKHDANRRRCFVRHTSSTEDCQWIVEILDNDELKIKSKKFNEYLYAASFGHDEERRFVFAYNQSGECDDSCIWKLKF